MKGVAKIGKRALLIIDMLNDFILPGSPLEVPQARSIIPHIKRELNNARREGIPVIYLCDQHQADDPEFQVWPPHAVKGTEGAEVVSELKPQPGDYIIVKTSYSGFFETELDSLLRRLGVNELILTGVVTNICILYTGADAYMRGYRVSVSEEQVAALDEENHRFALRQLREILKPKVR
ncbi:MAG: cysteine hydrolase [Candidatus Aminicenantes bacterium]|nr:cysteine hydrolase [Candidatus Aminicenantes bacterium]